MRFLFTLLLLGVVLDGNAKPKTKHKMALSESLVAYYDCEQEFSQGFHLWNQVPPHTAPIEHFPFDPTLGLVSPYAQSVAGKVGKAFYLTPLSTHMCDNVSEHRTDGDKTIAFWFNIHAIDVSNFLFWKNDEYLFRISTDYKMWISGQSGGFTHSKVLARDTWYLCILTVRATGAFTSDITLRINNEIPETGTLGKFPVGAQLIVGALSFEGALDEIGFWDRVLTANEQLQLYNNGNGITYADIAPPAKALSEQCRNVPCCEDNPFDYTSATGSGLGYSSDCFPVAEVTFEPPNGSTVVFPVFVLLSTNVSGAVIRYTTDGTDPTEVSALYTSSGVSVVGPVTEVRARAYVDGCDAGPVSSASYLRWLPDGTFAFACDTPDFVGQWGVFVPDGSNDYHWNLQMTLPSITSIRRIDIIQLDSTGQFSTGQAWSTAEFPFSNNFRAFPLLLRVGGVSQNNAYTDNYSGTFGNFAAAAHNIDLYGQIATALPTSNFFKLLIKFADGSAWTEVVAVRDSGCVVIDPPCVAPAAATFVNTCAAIEVTFACAVGTAYEVLRSLTAVGGFSVVDSGTVATNPQTFVDATVTAGVIYYYSIGNVPSGCVDFVYSSVASGRRLPPAVVSISASPATIDPGQSSTISWSSSEISGATVTITPTIGAQPSNVASSQVVSPAATQIYEISGSNTCGAVTAQATVTVNPPVSCGDPLFPHVMEIVGYHTDFFDSATCIASPTGSNTWNGRFSRLSSSGCTYRAAASSLTLNDSGGFGKFITGQADSGLNNTHIAIEGGLWTLTVGPGFYFGYTVWRGTKPAGTGPTGIYTRTLGCSATPASLTVATV